MESIWQRVDGQEIRLRVWEGGAVLYDLRSGDTHLFDELSYAVWQSIGEQRAGIADIARRTADCLETEDDDTLRQYVARCLGRFDSLGIIRVATA